MFAHPLSVDYSCNATVQSSSSSVIVAWHTQGIVFACGIIFIVMWFGACAPGKIVRLSSLALQTFLKRQAETILKTCRTHRNDIKAYVLYQFATNKLLIIII